MERFEFQLNEYAQARRRDPFRVYAGRRERRRRGRPHSHAFLVKQVVKYVADGLSKNIGRLCAGGSPGLITIRGPERVLRPVPRTDRRFAGRGRLCRRGQGGRGGRRSESHANSHRASALGRVARLARRLSGADESATRRNHHHQAPQRARGRASRRRMEDRFRRFHDRDDGVLSRAVDHQRDRQEHQDAHRPLFQSGEGRGAGEGAEGHSRRFRTRTRIRGTGSAAPNGGKAASGHGETAGGIGRDEDAKASSPKHKAINGARRRRSRRRPRRTRPSPIRPCRKQELFSDPRASLDKIAGVPPPGPRIDPSATLKGYGEVGPSADEALRDPFRPLGSDRAINVVNPDPGRPRRERRQRSGLNAAGRSVGAKPRPAPSRRPKPAGTAESPAASSAAPGSRRGRGAPKRPRPTCSRTEEAARRARASRSRGPQLDVQATDEGILISLTDRQNYSMFAIGSAEPQPRVVRMMEAVAVSLQTMPGAIIVRGHTDARPYRSATYDNWRLSSARAQMAYYMLSRGGRRRKAVRADRGLRRPPPQGAGATVGCRKPPHRNSAARGDAMSVARAQGSWPRRSLLAGRGGRRPGELIRYGRRSAADPDPDRPGRQGRLCRSAQSVEDDGRGDRVGQARNLERQRRSRIRSSSTSSAADRSLTCRHC